MEVANSEVPLSKRACIQYYCVVAYDNVASVAALCPCTSWYVPVADDEAHPAAAVCSSCCNILSTNNVAPLPALNGSTPWNAAVVNGTSRAQLVDLRLCVCRPLIEARQVLWTRGRGGSCRGCCTLTVGTWTTSNVASLAAPSGSTAQNVIVKCRGCGSA